MSDIEAIARDYLEAFNRRDWDRIRELFAPEYSYTGGDGQKREGPEAGLAVAQMWSAAFSDAKIDIRHIHTAEHVATVEFTGSGTHDGELMGIAPTGKRVSIPACTVLKIKDGKIKAEREYMDMAHMMQQLGVVGVPAAATA